MREKFGRRLRGKENFSFGFDVDFEVESYLRYRGSQFVYRFDANSYLYITKAMDYFDLTNGHGTLAAALEKTQARFLVISFSSDWLYPSYQSQELVRALRSRNRDVAYVEVRLPCACRNCWYRWRKNPGSIRCWKRSSRDPRGKPFAGPCACR